jgi:hypothetical protein
VRRLIALLLAAAVATSSCTPASEDEGSPLAEQLESSVAVVDGTVTELYSVLAMPFEDRGQLYTRIIDLQLPTTIAIERDKASRVIPPPGSEEVLERYVAQLGEILLASEALDAAIASEDPVATALAAVSIEASAGTFAVALPAESCISLALTIARDLCGRSGLDGYERELDFEIRRFVASFRPAFRIPATFGDVIRARALGSLQSDATLVLQNTATRLGALEPGPAYTRLHAILLDYFPAAAEVWTRFEADPAGTDPLLYDYVIEGLEEQRLMTRLALENEYDIVLAADAESQIVEILGIWFDEPPDTDTPE